MGNFDSPKRSFVKTVSWEAFHLVGIAGVIFIITGEWEYATWGALTYIIWEAVGYFIHERIWSQLSKVSQRKRPNP